MLSPQIVEGLVKDRAAWPRAQVSLVLLVLDGVGDIHHPDFGMRTPLEAARTPNLDDLARRSALGRIVPVDHGITPGSGPAHLGLLGYDPRQVEIGRGVLEAVGLDMDLRGGDVAARANFCTLRDGIVVDRRAGRPATEVSAQKVGLLQQNVRRIEDVEVILRAGKEHRFAAIFRGEGLAEGVSDTDPHENGEPIRKAEALRPEAAKIARIVNEFHRRAQEVLAGQEPLNAVLMRGLAALPHIPSMEQRLKLRSCAVAAYPMYRGLARLAGMKVLEAGPTAEEAFRAYARNKDRFDFCFIHVKGTDAAGEDGDFDRKVGVIEEVDGALPIILGARPEALAITGDHSTPCCMRLHSWHPVPLLLHSPRCDAGGQGRFTERDCQAGALGTFLSMHLMSLLMAHAGLLDKFGA